MMGLSIGVHLLNLLSIPAIVMVYYYRRYQPTTKGAIWAFLIGCAITGIVQLGVIQYSMKAAGIFDVFFVNKAGLPFFSGFALYFLAVTAAIVWALRLNERKVSTMTMIIWFNAFILLAAFPFFASKGAGVFNSGIMNLLLLVLLATLAGYFFKPTALRVLKLSLWSYSFMMLGYFMYLTALIRSNANPTIDMNNVDNPINLVYYLSREQYGEAPLVYGPHFAAQYKYGDDGYVVLKEGEMKYVKGKNKYIPIGREKKPQYESSDMQLFPRVWDSSNDQYHAEFYADWLNLRDEQTGKYIAPTYADNFNWFFTYQMGLMYWRYFMWNFAGKQNDVQGLGNKRDGNWITGISLIDDKRLGDQSLLPESVRHNKAKNSLYLLPFLLGIIGCVYQYLKNRKDWIVNFLLFFFTGMAIVLYLNQPGNQPRERDYAYVGSFYAFAIWIGLAVVALVKLVRDKADKLTLQQQLIYGGGLTFTISLLSCINDTGSAALMVPFIITAIYAAFTFGATYLLRALSGGGSNERMLNIATTVICLAVPALMAKEEWDDHDRSHKTTAPDMAKDYLESCAPNAIIFTFGDNDTYPLWYAQEVEGIRPDIRVINNSLLGIDWYINQLRYRVNQADSLDVLWTPEQIEGHNREFLRYRAEGDPNQYYDLYDVMKNVLGRPGIDEVTGRDVGYGFFPVAKFRLPVDTALVRSNGTVNPGDNVLPQILFQIPKDKLDGGLVRSDFIILNILATNNWKRPIYFTSAFGELGFGNYLRKDGLSYRLVPAALKAPQESWLVHTTLRQVGLGGTQIRDNNTDVLYNNLMTKYETGGAGRKNMYFDEENRRHLLSLRALYGEAAGNMADAGRKEEAGKLIDKVEAGILEENLPYAMVSRYSSHNQNGLLYLEACYKAGKKDVAEKVRKALRKDIEQQRAYYIALNGGNIPNITQFGKEENTGLFEALTMEYRINEALMIVLDELEMKYAPETRPKPVTQPTPQPGGRTDSTNNTDTTIR
jgi:hypothetical protein